MATYKESRSEVDQSFAGRSGAGRTRSGVSPGDKAPPPDLFVSLLSPADIRINGDRPWDIRVHHPGLYKRVLRDGSIGLGEGYMDGWWDCDRLDEMFTRLIGAQIGYHVPGPARFKLALSALACRLINFQGIRRAFTVGEQHYDIGNDLYRKMLDPEMNYSCGYWENAETLAQAQQDKLDLICRKLKLEPGMKMLDIGCGWGGLAAYAAEQYGVEVTGITVSREQKKLGDEWLQGLPARIELADYRSLTGRYDRLVSVGMFEHVGAKNYRRFFRKAAELLDDEGIFLLHTIGNEETSAAPDPFIHRYIFPNGKIPSRKKINDASLGLWRLEDWHNFGPDYDRTLMAWDANIRRAWPELGENYSRRFQRMWHYYLNCCAGFFRSRQGQLWQLVFTKPCCLHKYHSVR
ncbi:MAG: cyclopropane fatty acyl phospholipid synthase [Desulfosalsimonadaceae bacterium]